MSNDTIGLVMAFNKAVTERDWATFGACLADDVSYTVMAYDLPGGGTPMDRTTLLETLPHMIQLFAPGSPQLRPTNVISTGEWVVAEMEGSGSFRDGTPYENRYVLVYQVRDGLIRTAREYMDTQRMVGLLASAMTDTPDT